MPSRRYLSAKDIQATLGISRTSAYEVMAQLRCVKFGRIVRASEESFARWLKYNETRPAAPQSLDARRAKFQFWREESGLDVGEFRPTRRMKPRT